MTAWAALLSLLLAGPALAAPPLSPAADTATIHYEIAAADPAITARPASVERLLAVAELVEARLEAAVELRDVADLFSLTVTARMIAYQRTSEALHLCQLLVAAEQVLARPSLPPSLSAEASAIRDAARADLAGHEDATCAEPPREPEPEVEVGLKSEPAVEPIVTPPPKSAPPAAPRDSRRGLTIAGSTLLGTAALAAIALIPVEVRRARAYNELEGLIADIEKAGERTEEQAQRMGELGGVATWTRSARIGISVSAAALALIGVGLVAAGSKRRGLEHARVVPYGGPHGAGVGLHGHF